MLFFENIGNFDRQTATRNYTSRCQCIREMKIQEGNYSSHVVFGFATRKESISTSIDSFIKSNHSIVIQQYTIDNTHILARRQLRNYEKIASSLSYV